jgi:catechol 2,3-dioxygenase-like lactoylglutathione lyase family enzyme
MRVFLFSLAAMLLGGAAAQTTDSTRFQASIPVVCLLVNDHDEAIAWYTEKLGFKVKQDVKYGANSRWVTLWPQEGGLELSLGLAKTAADSLVVGKQGGSYPFFVLASPDVPGSYEAMKARGVSFTGEPKRGPGGLGAAFLDLYGNTIHLRGK